ncbi:hypothetical protein ACFQWG_10180 [Schaalia naturae]|uniref:ABC-2 type transport system permease protein n=1 Tax=Schaalia naturae TaxID=635203 RepID=A0ABW2SPZ5_9ACTO
MARRPLWSGDVPAPGGSAGAGSPSTRIDRAALRRARRVIRGSEGSTPQDLLYRIYVTVLLAVLIAGPLVSGVAGQVRDVVAQAGAEGLTWNIRAALSVLILLGGLAPAWLGPVIASQTELHYLIDGPFGVRPVVQARTWGIVVGLIVVALVPGIMLVWAAALTGLPALACVVWSVAAALLLGAGLLTTQTGRAAPLRAVTVVVGGTLAATSLSARTAGVALGSGRDLVLAGALAAFGLGGAAAVPMLLDHVSLVTLASTIRTRRMIRAGMAVGDIRGVSVREQPPRRSLRDMRRPMPRGRIRRAASVDLLSVVRRPWRAVLSALAVIAAGAVAVAVLPSGAGEGVPAAQGGGPAVLALPLCLIAVSLAFGVWAKGLQDLMDTVGAGRLGPEGFLGDVARHLVLPAAVTVVGLGAGAVLGTLAGLATARGAGPGPAAIAEALILLAIAGPSTTLALAGSAGVPPQLLDATVGPAAEMTAALVALWLGRGILPAALLAAVIAVAGPAAGAPIAAVVLVPACLLAALWHLRTVRRTDLDARGQYLAVDA